MKSVKAIILVAFVFCAVPSFAALNAYLKLKGQKQGDIKGQNIQISGFHWGTQAAAPQLTNAQGNNTLGCATNEFQFTATGDGAALLTQKCQKNESLGEVTIDYMNTSHVLQGASIRSCQNNLFTVHFDRCATHPATKALAASMVNPTAMQTRPNAKLAFGAEGPEELTLVGVQQLGPNNVVLKQRGASPTLMQHCANGRHYDKVVLQCRKAGGDQQPYLVITMSDVLVSSYQTMGDGSVLVGLKFGKADGSFAGFQDVH
ncbi:MAG TPA: type VI secretion system tube protein Hcp [Thermoanaerobaculia bacterium]